MPNPERGSDERYFRGFDPWAGKVGIVEFKRTAVMNPSHRITVRSCIDCRKRENPAALLRVVCVDGRVLPDPGRTAPGRGGWVHRECAVRAVERGAFRWAFRRDENVDGSELLDYIARMNSQSSTYQRISN